MTNLEEKRTQLIWAVALLMFGLAIIASIIIPGFGFWEGAGIFLVGTGVVSLLLQLFMGERGSVGFPIFLTIAGLFLLLKSWIGSFFPDFGFGFWAGIALVIIAVGAILSIVLKK